MCEKIKSTNVCFASGGGAAFQRDPPDNGGASLPEVPPRPREDCLAASLVMYFATQQQKQGSSRVMTRRAGRVQEVFFHGSGRVRSFFCFYLTGQIQPRKSCDIMHINRSGIVFSLKCVDLHDVAGWVPYDLHDLRNYMSWVGYVLYNIS